MHVLPEPPHRELRLDRNRYKIAGAEQARLLELRVAVAGLRAVDLRGLTTKQKVPYVLRILDAGRMQPRAAALVEVGQTLSTPFGVGH
ncbi:MAG: hypothetical protein ACRDTF_21260 [Pseudonocardiaceae bacterium]